MQRSVFELKHMSKKVSVTLLVFGAYEITKKDYITYGFLRISQKLPEELFFRTPLYDCSYLYKDCIKGLSIYFTPQ